MNSKFAAKAVQLYLSKALRCTGEAEVCLHSFLPSVVDEGELTPRPGSLPPPPEGTPVPTEQEAGGGGGGSGQFAPEQFWTFREEKNLYTLPGFELRIFSSILTTVSRLQLRRSINVIHS